MDLLSPMHTILRMTETACKEEDGKCWISGMEYPVSRIPPYKMPECDEMLRTVWSFDGSCVFANNFGYVQGEKFYWEAEMLLKPQQGARIMKKKLQF